MSIWAILALILFAAGFVLIGIELFVPGFGWPGISGIICFVGGVFITVRSFEYGMLIVLGCIVIAGLLFWLLMRKLAKGKFKSPLILKDEIEEKGSYVSSKGLSEMEGKIGTTLTDLRPTGTARFEDRELDVVSSGKFILKGKQVVIVKAEGYRLVVKETEEE